METSSPNAADVAIFKICLIGLKLGLGQSVSSSIYVPREIVDPMLVTYVLIVDTHGVEGSPKRDFEIWFDGPEACTGGQYRLSGNYVSVWVSCGRFWEESCWRLYVDESAEGDVVDGMSSDNVRYEWMALTSVSRSHETTDSV